MGLLSLSIAAALSTQTAALPQGEGTGSIIVTGERVARSLKDTPSSVEVVSGRLIEAASADRVEQVLDLIPNVQISSGGEGPTIRGQDTTGASRDLYAFLGGTRPRTTLVVDGRAVSSNEFIFGISPLWDVDRVEVFRTPQTTTQGRNSIAGAIFVETKDPSFTPEYRARAIIGEARTRQVSALAGGPIIPGEVAWRVAGDLRYSRTSSRIADLIQGADPNHDVYGLLRVKLLALPAALPGSRVEIGYSHSESQMPQVEGLRPPFHERRDPLDGYGTFRSNVDSLTANLSYDLGTRLTIRGLLSGGDSRFRRYAPAGLGQTQIKTRDWSGELIANWTPTTSLKTVAGLSHYRSHLDQVIDLSQLSGIGRFDDQQVSTGLYGEVSWVFAARATLTAGIRYQRDGQDRVGALATSGSPIALNFHQIFEAWLPKVSLAYDFAPSIRAGILIQKAYNPGGTTLRFDTGAPDNFAAERLWDYELFARAALLDERLTVSGNLFYYDQRNAQRAQPIVIIAPTGAPVTFADLFNVPKARSYGSEVTADWRATHRLTLRSGVGFLRTRILDAGDRVAFEGKLFQRSPRFSATLAADWRPVDRLQLSAQLRHNSGYFSDDLNSVSRHVGAWTKLDARAEWNAGTFRLFGYARNLFDKFYLTYLFGPTLATAGDPRELGVGVEARF